MMNKEILLVVEALSNEKGVEEEIIFQAIEAALESATRKRLALDDVDVRVRIDRRTGAYSTIRRWEVVADEAEACNPVFQMRLADARVHHPEVADRQLRRTGLSRLNPPERRLRKHAQMPT